MVLVLVLSFRLVLLDIFIDLVLVISLELVNVASFGLVLLGSGPRHLI